MSAPRAARAIGFKPALSPARDADHLATQLVETLGPGSLVLWPRGPLSQELGEALAGAGHSVLDPVVYETRTDGAPPPEGASLAHAILLASPSAVHAYLERALPAPVGSDDGARSGSRPTAIAIGHTTAGALEDHSGGFDAILTLQRPTPQAFQDLLLELDARSDT